MAWSSSEKCETAQEKSSANKIPLNNAAKNE